MSSERGSLWLAVQVILKISLIPALGGAWSDRALVNINREERHRILNRVIVIAGEREKGSRKDIEHREEVREAGDIKAAFLSLGFPGHHLYRQMICKPPDLSSRLWA